MKRSTYARALALAASVLVSGCSSLSPTAPTSPTPVPSSPTPTPTPASTPSQPGTPTPLPTPPATPAPAATPTPTPTPAPTGVTLGELQASVFSPRCANCHSGLRSASSTFAALVGVPSGHGSLLYVSPGDPDNSYLVRKIEGGPGMHGGRMPPSGSLSAQQLQDVRSWILAGALND